MKKIICGALAVMMLLSGCGTKDTSTPTEPEHVHSYEGVVLAVASCLEQGGTQYQCDCGRSYTERVDPLGHSYVTSVILPTAMAPGCTRYTCSRCGDSYDEGETAPVYSGAQKDYLLPLTDFSRPREQAPEFVMIHFTSAVVLSREDPFHMDAIRSIFVDYEVSVHYIIDRDGTVRCYIPESLVAWHAGTGTWQDDPKYTNKLNDYAIGIELVAIGSQTDMKQYLTASDYQSLNPDWIGFTDAQYEALEALVRDICLRNEIPMDRDHVIGHQEYSPKKTDPGELFDWDRLMA